LHINQISRNLLQIDINLKKQIEITYRALFKPNKILNDKNNNNNNKIIKKLILKVEVKKISKKKKEKC
jgi:hypothetical protein